MNPLINLAQRPRARARDHEVAAGVQLPGGADERICWCEPGGRQVLGASAPRPSGCITSSRAARTASARRGHSARVLQHRLVLRAVLGQPHHRSAAGRSASSAASARRRSTSASAAATARTSARSKTGSPEHPRLPDDRAPSGSLRARGPRIAGAISSLSSSASSARARSSAASGVRRDLRALPLERAGAVDADTDFHAIVCRATRPAPRLSQQREARRRSPRSARHCARACTRTT